MQNRQGTGSEKTKKLTLLAMFTSIIFLLAFTPIGLIDLPLIKATILHVPVIIASILLGPICGGFLGFVFGLTSLIKNTMAPSLLSFAFSPFIPVPGMDHGSIFAILICFLPRILVGVAPWFIYKGVFRLNKHKDLTKQSVGITIAAIVGSLTNTILVMGMIFLIFKEAYATVKEIPVDAVLDLILGIILANGVPEAIVAAIIVPVVTIPLIKVLKLKPAQYLDQKSHA